MKVDLDILSTEFQYYLWAIGSKHQVTGLALPVLPVRQTEGVVSYVKHLCPGKNSVTHTEAT